MRGKTVLIKHYFSQFMFVSLSYDKKYILYKIQFLGTATLGFNTYLPYVLLTSEPYENQELLKYEEYFSVSCSEKRKGK